MHNSTSDNGQGKLTQDDWARIWFSKLAKFHKIHDAKKWWFQQDDVVAFLKSKVKAGVPAWKRLKVVEGLIHYRNKFMRASEPRLEHLRTKLQERATAEREQQKGSYTYQERPVLIS